MTNKRDDFRGFSLFSDIEDYVLRVRNRACVLANMAEDNSKSSLINAKGVSLILGYFQQVPEDERDLETVLLAHRGVGGVGHPVLRLRNAGEQS